MGTESTEPRTRRPRTTTACTAPGSLIMGEEFHYGFFATAETPLERATDALTQPMLDRGTPRSRRPGARRRLRDRPPGLRPRRGLGRVGARHHDERERCRGGDRSWRPDRRLAGAASNSATAPTTGSTDAAFDVGVGPGVVAPHARQAGAAARVRTRILAPAAAWCCATSSASATSRSSRCGRVGEDFALLRRAFGDAHMEPLDDYTSTLAAARHDRHRRHGHQRADPADLRRLAGQRRHPRGQRCAT